MRATTPTDFVDAFARRDEWMTHTFELCRPLLAFVQELRGRDVHISESYVPDGTHLVIFFRRSVEEAPSLSSAYSLKVPVELLCRGQPAAWRGFVRANLVTLPPSP